MEYEDEAGTRRSKRRNLFGFGGQAHHEDEIPVTLINATTRLRSIDDANEVANGLKNGHSQIVIFRNTSDETKIKVLDYLAGVVYAIEGTMHKLHETVYLVLPPNVEFQSDDR